MRKTRVPSFVLAATTALLFSATAPALAAQPTTPVPVCAGAKTLVVDVTQDVTNDIYLTAADGHVWALFSYTQHVRIWTVGGRQHCVQKDVAGTWVSVAGASPGLTGTVPDGLTGTFTGSETFMWTGKLATGVQTSGSLEPVDAGCTPELVCATDSHLIVSEYYFGEGYQHCVAVRASVDIDGGEHGRIEFSLGPGLHQATGEGDIVG